MPDVDLAAVRAVVRDLIIRLRAVPIDCTALTGPVWYGEGWKDAVDHLELIADAWPGDEATDLAKAYGRIRRLQKAARDARREADCYRADHRDRQGLPSDPRHAGCRAAEAEAPEVEPAEAEDEPEERGFEFRLSPDRRQVAIWEPGNEPWFIPERNMPGRFVGSTEMDRMGWTRFTRTETNTRPSTESAAVRPLEPRNPVPASAD
ncbi:hypothetical protein OG216_09835 [Streptomycetaceae bacterium NBC_01309]